MFQDLQQIMNPPSIEKVPAAVKLRLDLRSVLLDFPSASHFLNITAFMTWADEDFVGRISRAE